jgi:cysteine desulfurase
MKIYLDNNGSTPLDPRVADFLIQILPNLQGNPSSTHQSGQSIKGLVTKARSSIATYLRTKPQELVFTSGGTESVNMAIRGLAGTSPGHIITSSVEHACVIGCCKLLQKQGFEVTFLSPGAHGAVLPEAVREAIRPDTRLVALMAANNETGVKTDIAAIAAITQERKISFFVDAVALLGKEDLVIPAGVSAMAFSGHKVHALQGTGMLFLRSGVKCQPLIIGGEQEYGRRAGSENILGILSLAKAMELLSSEGMVHMQLLRETFETTLLKALPWVLINGEGPRTSNVSNIAFMGTDGETLLMNLDRHGIEASHGSACSSGSLEPSRVLVGMGLPVERVAASIRFSFSRLTTLKEVEEACKVIINLCRQKAEG